MCTDDQIQIDELDAMIEEKDKRIAELEAELANWKDMGVIARTTALNHYDLLRKADADNARLRKCLEGLEWVDKYTPSGRLMPFCPACGSPKATGHQVDCWLAAEIGGK